MPPFPPSPQSHSRAIWTYDKTENLEESQLLNYTHRIAESPGAGGWVVVDTIQSFDGWDLDLSSALLKEGRLWEVVKMRRKDVLWILERI
jgi:hypothetical protein